MPCPFLARCDEKVDFGKFKVVCNGSLYYFCSRYKEITKDVRKPRDWLKEI